MSRLAVVLSGAALALAVLGTTSLGHAAGLGAEATPRQADTAKVAANALKLGGFKPSAFVRLDAAGKIPTRFLPGAKAVVGPQGPKGDPGPKGDTGPKGDAGAAGTPGLVSAYATPAIESTIYKPADGTTIASLNLPEGRFMVTGRVDVATLTTAPKPASFYAVCRLTVGNDYDFAQVRAPAGTVSSVIPVTLLALGTIPSGGSAATMKCTGSQNEPATWANVRIVAVQVRDTISRPAVGGAAGGGAAGGAVGG